MVPDPSQVTTFTPPHAKGPVIRSDGTYPPFGKKEDIALQLSISRMISVWTRKTWAQVRTQNSLLPPTTFLSQALQDHLCEKFHVITTIDKLAVVLADWPRLEQYKAELFCFCQEALKALSGLRKEAREESESEGEERKPIKIRIRPPQAPPSIAPSKTGRDESDAEGPSVGERPKKKHCGESRMVV
jgi:hypothetical protein